MSQENFQRFERLHHGEQALLLANVWDAASARLCASLGVEALATSSAGVAWARGYADGSALPEDEFLSAVASIVRVTDLPLSVDFEDGYSDDPAAVVHLIEKLVDLGVVGINLEDGAKSPDLLVSKIKAIREALGDRGLYINARTDIYLRNLVPAEQRLQASLERAQQYIDAGASGIFLPGMHDAEEIKQATQSLSAPVNLLIEPGIPDYATLNQLQVKRLSAGSGTFLAAYDAGLRAMHQVSAGEWPERASDMLTYPQMNQHLQVE